MVSLHADVRDSILYLIDHNAEYSNDYIDDRMETLSNALFNELNADEIGTFCDIMIPKAKSVKSIKARMHLLEINCAYLNNSSQFDKAEDCGLSVVALGEKNQNHSITVSGLEDLNFIYNHQGRYREQIKVLDKAIALRQTHQLEPSEDLAYDLMWKAEAYSYIGKFDSAYINMDLTTTLIPPDNDMLKCNIYERYSRIALEQGNYNESMKYAQMALDIAREAGLKIRIQTNLMYLGYSSFYLGQYAEAISHEKEALALYEGTRDANTASVYSRLGKVYNANGEYSTALEYLNKSMDIYEEIDYDIGKAKVNVGLSKSYLGLQDKKKARASTSQAITTFTINDDKLNLASAYMAQALIETQYGLCELALGYQKSALDILTESQKLAALGRAKLEESQILSQCNLIADAYNSAEKAIELSTISGDVLTTMNANLKLAEIAEKESQFQQALQYRSEYHKIYQRISNQSNQRALAQEKVRFNVERAEEKQLLSELKNESLLQKNRILQIAGISFLSLIGFLAYFLYKRQKYTQILKSKNIHITQQKNELQELSVTKDKFFSIIAHDLRSPLVAFQGIGKQIKYYSKHGEKEKLIELSGHIEDLSLRLNTLLDNLLNWSLVKTGQISYKPHQLNVKDEIEEALEIFTPLAMEKKIDLTPHIEQSETTIHADVRAVQTILRNIYSNAIKFTQEGGCVKTEISEEKNRINIKITDNGVGMSEAQLKVLFQINKSTTEGTKGEKGSGLGAMLTQELITMNQGELKVSSTIGKGTVVNIYLPKAV